MKENIKAILEHVGEEQEDINLYHKDLHEYVKFWSIRDNKLLYIRENRSRFEIVSIESAQEVLFPHEEHLSWENWRKYLFIEGGTFITPKSYAFQSPSLSRSYMMNECLNLRAVCVENFDSKIVHNCLDNQVVISNFDDYRFATDSEILAFFKDVDTIENNGGVKPKFKPGDVVVLQDYITGKNFIDSFIIGDRIFSEGTWKYKIGYLYGKMMVDEKYLVKCSVIPESKKEDDEHESEIQQEQVNKEDIKITEPDDDDLL